MSLRNTDVPMMMTRVQSALLRASRKGGTGPVFVPPEGDSELGIVPVRRHATIQIDFPSGSSRPVVGPTIRTAKRVVRRGLRWYIKPIVDQQMKFNHGALDLIERLRLANERLRAEVEDLRERYEGGEPAEVEDG